MTRFSLVLLLLAHPLAASAWGTSGHRITGEIAWQHLGTLSKEARGELLADLPSSGRYRMLYEAATWPDTYARSQPQYEDMKPYHYIDADPDSAAVDVAADCGERCVVNGITRFANALCDDSPDNDEFAVFWLAHLVGDIHQPLHVSHPDGRGGNKTWVSFRGEGVNLHKLWDTTMLEAAIAQHASWDYEFQDYDEFEADLDIENDVMAWQILALQLHGTITDQEKQAWGASLDPTTWAQESLALSKEHAFWVKTGYHLGTGYLKRAMPDIERRLQQAGVRLAALLEAIYTNESARPSWLSCAP